MKMPPVQRISSYFQMAALVFLLTGLGFGFFGTLQYLFPSWLKDEFSFARTRPLHVSFVIAWIFTGATSGIYVYLPLVTGKPLYSPRLGMIHWILLITSMILIAGSFLLGIFGGREYLEFPAWISLLIIGYWLLFTINYFLSIRKLNKPNPVYIWMWSTGILFFLLTFSEAHLWLFGFFKNNIVRDTTVQWKALGSMVGSWNMLVYGTAFFLMEKIGGNTELAQAKSTFFFYFLGLINLMFNWGHHTYIVPASDWIRITAYAISMTELLILWNIIRSWKKNLLETRRNFHHMPYRFLAAADFWIFLNLCLALALSVPAVNRYTHGTYFTVAHAMGATIGINTMILFASFVFMAELKNENVNRKMWKWMNLGYWTSNIFLIVFWLSMISVGIMQGLFKQELPHAVLMQKLTPLYIIFSFSGFILLIGLTLIVIPLIGNLSMKNRFS